MDLVSSTEHICYVRCAYCNTVLAVGVPCRRLMDTVTVKCGHCNHLSFLSPRPVLQAHYSEHQMAFQDPCNDCKKGQFSASSSSISTESKAPYVVKPPEKKHRLPSAYNRFMREEIQRIKAAKPDIPHREAFSMAAKNWAKCDPRGSSSTTNANTDNSTGTLRTLTFHHDRGSGFAVESIDVFKTNGAPELANFPTRSP